MQGKIVKARKKSIFWGVVGGILLLSVYFIIVSLANSFSHAIEEFIQLWYWIAFLTVGFGIQVGLYTHVRQTIQLKKEAKHAASAVAAGAGVSTVSMIACCAHHLTDFLPILGLSAAAAFLSSYQLVFIMVGIISNILGITYMLSIISKHHLYFNANRWLSKLSAYSYRSVFKIEVPVLVIMLLVSITLLPTSEVLSEDNSNKQEILLEEKQVSGNGISVDVSGIYNRPQKSIIFTVKFTTHSGSMDFRVDEIATLMMNDEKISIPATWEGSPPGGHHRSGKLSYKDVPADSQSIILKLSTKGRMGVRRFIWDL